MTKNKILINSLYLGPVELWKHLCLSPCIYVESKENYQKKSYRNKCEILCSSGVELLSIPLKKGKHGGIPITEVEISYVDLWIEQHDKKISDAYIKAPYFDFYIHGLRDIWKKKFKHLFDLNDAVLKWTLEALCLDIPVVRTTTFQKIAEDDEITDLRPMSKLGKRSNPLSNHTYPQVYEYKFGFKPNLSILDLIMNQGPEAVVYLKQMKDK